MFLAKHYFKRQRSRTRSCKKPPAADAYLQEEQPSLLLLDNKLPDGFGIDWIPTIKKKYPAIKVAMISGFDGAAKDVALHNGADTYLQKPYTREQLSNTVKDLLS